MPTLTFSAVKKLGFPIRDLSNLYNLNISMPHLLNATEKKPIKLAFPSKLSSLAHHQAIHDLSLFYHKFHGFCSHVSTFDTLDYVRPTRHSSHMHPYTIQLQKHRTPQFRRSLASRELRTNYRRCFSSSLNFQLLNSLVDRLEQLLFLHTTSKVYSAQCQIVVCHDK